MPKHTAARARAWIHQFTEVADNPNALRYIATLGGIPLPATSGLDRRSWRFPDGSLLTWRASGPDADSGTWHAARQSSATHLDAAREAGLPREGPS